MELSNISNERILEGLYKWTHEFHNNLRAEYIAMHILERYGIYHEVSLYLSDELIAELYLKEAERRGLALDMNQFKYDPRFSIDRVNNLIADICERNGDKGERVLPIALEYSNKNADKILYEGLVKVVS